MGKFPDIFWGGGRQHTTKNNSSGPAQPQKEARKPTGQGRLSGQLANPLLALR